MQNLFKIFFHPFESSTGLKPGKANDNFVKEKVVFANG